MCIRASTSRTLHIQTTLLAPIPVESPCCSGAKELRDGPITITQNMPVAGGVDLLLKRGITESRGTTRPARPALWVSWTVPGPDRTSPRLGSPPWRVPVKSDTGWGLLGRVSGPERWVSLSSVVRMAATLPETMYNCGRGYKAKGGVPASGRRPASPDAAITTFP